MKFVVQLECTDGGCLASCDDPQTSALGNTAANALDRLRDELRYRLEMCPCSGIEADAIDLEVC